MNIKEGFHYTLIWKKILGFFSYFIQEFKDLAEKEIQMLGKLRVQKNFFVKRF